MSNTHGKSGGDLTTQEWYDMVSIAANLVSGIHAGEKGATQQLLDLLKIEAQDYVLDIGSGPGVTAAVIANQTGARVTGVDLSPGMVAKARQRAQKLNLADKIKFQEGDVLNLAFEEDTFDVVLFESLLTILPGDPQQALAEMVRVLKPGGRIGGNEGIIDPGVRLEMDDLLEKHPAIQRIYTAEELRNQFEIAGIEIQDMITATQSQLPAFDLKSALKEIGCGGLISFFITAYPQLVWKLITDRRFREANQIDEQVTRMSKQHMGYALIVGQTP
jgi:ubiquinone/menaquinone biosynthesis C-methylase UbiE